MLRARDLEVGGRHPGACECSSAQPVQTGGQTESQVAKRHSWLMVEGGHGTRVTSTWVSRPSQSWVLIKLLLFRL